MYVNSHNPSYDFNSLLKYPYFIKNSGRNYWTGTSFGLSKILSDLAYRDKINYDVYGYDILDSEFPIYKCFTISSKYDENLIKKVVNSQNFRIYKTNGFYHIDINSNTDKLTNSLESNGINFVRFFMPMNSILVETNRIDLNILLSLRSLDKIMDVRFEIIDNKVLYELRGLTDFTFFTGQLLMVAEQFDINLDSYCVSKNNYSLERFNRSISVIKSLENKVERLLNGIEYEKDIMNTYVTFYFRKIDVEKVKDILKRNYINFIGSIYNYDLL